MGSSYSNEASASNDSCNQANQANQGKKGSSCGAFLEWAPREACPNAVSDDGTRVLIGHDLNCTFSVVIQTTNSVTEKDCPNFRFKWRITIVKQVNINWPPAKQTCYVGFVDGDTDVSGWKVLGVEDGNKADPGHYSFGYASHQFCTSNAKVSFDFEANFKTKSVTLLRINDVTPTSELFPGQKTTWTFKSDHIYPAVCKDLGQAIFVIGSLDSSQSVIADQSDQSVQAAHRFAIMNRQFDSEEKENFGNILYSQNQVNRWYCGDIAIDKESLHIHDKYMIKAPNTITWNIAQREGNFRIDWGLRGSFCGLAIGRRFCDKRVLFHFGFVFNGNDYHFTNIESSRKVEDKHWMTIHLVNTNSISIELCQTKTGACKVLSKVWRVNGELDQKDYKYFRLDPGFSRKSVKVIANVINKEKKRKYELCYGRNDWTSMKDLSEYTNCMLFVIRMCKACDMKLPRWQELIAMFKQWPHDYKFHSHWEHFREYAEL